MLIHFIIFIYLFLVEALLIIIMDFELYNDDLSELQKKSNWRLKDVRKHYSKLIMIDNKNN